MNNYILEKVLNNTILKLQQKILKLKEKYNLIEYHPNISEWKKNHFIFHCKDHGLFTLNGLEVRENKSCPECKIHHKEKLMRQYQNNDLKNRKLLMELEFPNIDWSEVETKEFLDLDHTIRPNCLEHGEFITTPRKLFSGDNCKWCDGIKNIDGEYTYPLSSEEFKKEKISIVYDIKPENIILIDKTRFHLLETNQIGNILQIKKNEKYITHLKEVRDPSCWNSILFKINVIDKSSKFQFSVVSRISNLNEQWLKWYKDRLEADPENPEVAQTEATIKIISIWFNTVFYNKQIDDPKDTFQYEIVWSFWSNAKRIDTQYTNFKLDNIKKIMLLPKALQDKIYHNLKAIGVDCYWSDVKWESTSNSVSLIRETILNTNNICPVCKKTINKPVVDHEHSGRIFGTGRIRNNICSNCNVFIAKVENNCKRYGIMLEELPEVLNNISKYFTQQQYNILHYTEKLGKPFLSKTTANKILKYWEHLFGGKKKKIKYPRSGIITKDWEEAILEFNRFDKNKIAISKNEYKILLTKISSYNNNINIYNIGLPKTKVKKLLDIPEYPTTKYITPKIQIIMDKLNGQN